MDFFDAYLMQFIQEILMDSKEDPHFSAVAANNMILCYLEIMAELGQKLPYNSVKEYFEFQGFDPEEYDAFEKSRIEESGERWFANICCTSEKSTFFVVSEKTAALLL